MGPRTHPPWRRPLVPRQLGWWSTLGCSSIVLGADPPCHSNQCGTSQPTQADRGVTAEAPDNRKVHAVNSPLERQSAPSPQLSSDKHARSELAIGLTISIVALLLSLGAAEVALRYLALPSQIPMRERRHQARSINTSDRSSRRTSRCTRRTAAWPKWSDTRSAGIPERRHAASSRRGKRARLRSRAAHPEVVRVLLRRLALQRTRGARNRERIGLIHRVTYTIEPGRKGQVVSLPASAWISPGLDANGPTSRLGQTRKASW
jgi:hypothetical protein